ncbi:DUF1801 domain-containing protein [Agromyces atrinae]|uniref:DUF1801 domain-containing protein n=1 Tax=Agromyces atrinae TaxID=592376 RepID=A0A4V1R2T4_9MICO|nr:DUF1801 domain-containing protein [Agromyces atrinae]NYD67517.1 hypothetical protein [Agromyces atrinae]RXZ88266.1 hypothetical protein ESP50_03555 [Agromyces atrinae]
MTSVDVLLTERAHPLEESLTSIVTVLRGVPGVTESVKWNSPNYALTDDFATLQLRRDDAIQVVLHTGAKAKPEHPAIVVDALPAGARWAGHNRLVLTYREAALSPDDRALLAAVVRAWTSQLV